MLFGFCLNFCCVWAWGRCLGGHKGHKGGGGRCLGGPERRARGSGEALGGHERGVFGCGRCLGGHERRVRAARGPWGGHELRGAGWELCVVRAGAVWCGTGMRLCVAPHACPDKGSPGISFTNASTRISSQNPAQIPRLPGRQIPENDDLSLHSHHNPIPPSRLKPADSKNTPHRPPPLPCPPQ